MSFGSGADTQLGGTPPIVPRLLRPTVPAALLLFPLASVLAYMSQNLKETTLWDVVPVLAGTWASAVVVWLLVVVLCRRADAGSAVIACLWVLAGVYYLGLFGAFNDWIGGDYTLAATLPFVAAGLLLTSFAVYRLPGLNAPIHVVLTVTAVALVTTPLWRIAVYEWRNGDGRAVYDPDEAAAELARFAGPAPGAGAARPPDIYHFVFDRFGSTDTLARHYDSVATVGGFLESRGFYVASDSYSNYLKTGQSLGSTFYMDYLGLLSGDDRVASDAWQPVFAMLGDHRVARILHARGYSVLQFGSWWRGTHRNPVADENHPFGLSEFAMYYLRQTVLRTAIGLMPDSRLAGLLDWDNGQCQRVARQVEAIKAIGVRDQPVYVFAHFLMPHDPFVFAADGGCLSLDASNARGSRQGYVDQVAYASRVVETLVDALQDLEPPPVILMQSDEGPYPIRDYAVPWQEASGEELRAKTGILNAYFFPDGDYRLLRPDISPVNSYRVVFNTYLGASYPILPDRVFAFPDDTRLYEFYDVTERIRGEAVPEDVGGLGSR
ncbi:MAG: sulfatase-like hydrolase/transferase [Rhodobacteraceae bacterium]|nr:sulfatase-like hydrolase/transferase [Paracoccaceae bacterium]